MRTTKKTNFTRTNVVLLIVIAILAAALIVFMVITFLPKSEEESSGDQTTDTNIPTLTVETPYCELKYPEQWKDQMTVKESTSDGILAETFYAFIEGNHYELYTVYFGESKYGDLFGHLPNDDTTIPVYIECHRLAEGNALSETGLSLYYSMMEGVNEVVQSISDTDGYTTP